LEQGFAPRLSRVAAGVCLLLFFGALRYFFGGWVMLAIFVLPVLFALLVSVALPRSPGRKRMIDWAFKHLDVFDFFVERLDDRFESFERRLRR
jgi:hypothetical protein